MRSRDWLIFAIGIAVGLAFLDLLLRYTPGTIPSPDLIGAFSLGGLLTAAVLWRLLGLTPEDFERKNRGRFHLHRRLIFIATTSLLIGLFLIVVADDFHHRPELEDFLKDIGRAFIAAAIIGCVIELSEIRDFFSSLLTHLMTSGEFVRQLSEASLARHGEAVAKERVRQSVSNPDHAGKTLVHTVIEATVPHLCSTYRESYEEQISFVELRTPAELRDQIRRIWGEDIVLDRLDEPAYLLQCRATFFIVRPNEQTTAQPSDMFIDAKRIPGLDKKYHARSTVKFGGERETRLEFDVTEREDFYDFSRSYTIPLRANRTRVEIKSWEFNANRRTGFAVGMSHMTKGLSIVFSANMQVYPEIYTFSLNGDVDTNSTNDDGKVASLSRADLVLLPGHGYGMSWSMPGLAAQRAGPGGS